MHSLKPHIRISKGYRPIPSLYSQLHQIISFMFIIQEQEIKICTITALVVGFELGNSVCIETMQCQAC
jgi:hypothetical protein